MDTGEIDSVGLRRGSLNSLHRHLNESSTNQSKSQSPTTVNSTLGTLTKGLDKFTRYFILKAVQVVVQSRLSARDKYRTECKPSGNDWFSLNIVDLPEVNERTKAALEALDGFTVRANWRVFCEISVRTSDGARVVLEHWIFSNRVCSASSNKSLNYAGSPTLQPRVTSANLSHSASKTLIPNTTRTRSITSRSKLNSIDDSQSENLENNDFKSSVSCYSFSATQATTQDSAISTPATASPSSKIISNQANNNPAAQRGSPSVYTIYNKMSLLLKTIMTTSHIVPAFKFAELNSLSNSLTTCYKVYCCTDSYQAFSSNKSSNEANRSSSHRASLDMLNSESPNRQSTLSNASSGSIDLKDIVGADELEHFCPILKIGSIKTEINELEVALCYRTDLTESRCFQKESHQIHNTLYDEECITAAKQLLAGNENDQRPHNVCRRNPSDSELHKDVARQISESFNAFDMPLKPAFASSDNSLSKLTSQDPNLIIIEPAFEGLISEVYKNANSSTQNDACTTILGIGKHRSKASARNHQDINDNLKSAAMSEPIQVPERHHNGLNGQNNSAVSTPRSLTESFVFVDLNPPFASDEQNDINSFFHGPAPAFCHGFDSMKDVDELKDQLATLEANASQIDEFVDNICVSDSEKECEEQE